MQVDPINATLKAHGTKRSKLKSYELLQSFAFDFKLRRYTKVDTNASGALRASEGHRPTVVGQCRLTLSNPS